MRQHEAALGQISMDQIAGGPVRIRRKLGPATVVRHVRQHGAWLQDVEDGSVGVFTTLVTSGR